MRLVLLLIIAGETLWMGEQFKEIADHYQYLEESCMYVFNKGDK